MSEKRPLITANMVTSARLIVMPLVCWFAYRGQLWPALIIGTIVGCTDFVDGYLARKHGPTVLGGLMDPVADKVFSVFAFVSFAGIGLMPVWPVALIFVREFLVTALRSAYEYRGLSMKTSYLAKVKTWTQMQGIGMIALFYLLGYENRGVLTGLLIAAASAPIVAMIALWVIKKRFWKGAIVMSAMCAPLILLHLYVSPPRAAEILIWFVAVVTWASGVDYAIGAAKDLKGHDFNAADGVRVLGSLLLPAAAFTLFAYTHVFASPIPVIAILSLELAAGGLDNLLSHHRAAASAWLWAQRVIGTSLLLIAALIAYKLDASIAVVDTLSWAAAVICLVGTVWEYVRGRQYYLDAKLRDKKLSGGSSSISSAA